MMAAVQEVGDKDVFSRFYLRAAEIGVQATLMVVGAGAVFMFFFGRQMGLMSASFGSVLIAGAIGAVIVHRLPWSQLLRAGKAVCIFHIWSSANILLITVAIAVTGGPDSDLFMFYGLSTIFFAAVFPRRDQLALFALTVLSYCVVLSLYGWNAPIESILLKGGFLAGLGFLGTFLAKELREQMTELRYVSLHDPLTGLANRVLFYDRARQALALARRNDKRVGMIIMDLDGFKAVNDSLGHAAGDRLLVQISQRLGGGLLRASDTVARLGGDEFAILLPHLDVREDAIVPAKRILEAMVPAFDIGEQVKVGCSLGVAVFPDDGIEAEDVVKAADVAMYLCKEGGGGYAVAGRETTVPQLRVIYI